MFKLGLMGPAFSKRFHVNFSCKQVIKMRKNCLETTTLNISPSLNPNDLKFWNCKLLKYFYHIKTQISKTTPKNKK